MKNYLILLILLMSISFVSALDIDLKESYPKSQTIILEVKGSVLGGLTKESIELRRGNVLVPIDYGLEKIGEKYFLWFITQSLENNYSLIIKNVSTTLNGKKTELTIIKNFTTINAYPDYYLKPGAVLSKEDFEIFIFLNKDEEQKILIAFPFEREITLKPGENILKFSIDDFEDSSLNNLKIGEYTIPVSIIGKIEKKNALNHVRFFPYIIEDVIFIEDRGPVSFALVNSGEIPLNLSLNFNQDAFELYPQQYFIIEPNNTLFFNLTLKESYLKEKEELNEIISVNLNNNSISTLPIKIKFTNNQSAVSRSPLNLDDSIFRYCSQLEGKICSTEEICDGEIKDTREGSCCVGECKLPEETSYSWIGYLIAGIIILIIAIIYSRYKKAH